MNVDIKMVPLSKSDIYSRWIIQICLWILILSIIILTPIDHSMLYLYIALLFLWLYFCFEMSAFANIHGCCSKKYDCPNITVYEKLKQIFKYPPRITWTIKCYHYETTNDSDDQINKNNAKVITFEASETMKFYSFRDISGNLKINFRELGVNRYGFFDLILNPNIDFCDDLTLKDYENQKNEFINAHKNKDKEYEINEIRDIPGLKELYNLKIIEGSPDCAAFFLATCVSFAELYNYYIGYYPIHNNNAKVNYEFKKIISTREDLNNPEYNKIYLQSDQKIDLGYLQFNYEPSIFTYLYENVNTTLPTEEGNEKINIGINPGKKKNLVKDLKMKTNLMIYK